MKNSEPSDIDWKYTEEQTDNHMLQHKEQGCGLNCRLCFYFKRVYPASCSITGTISYNPINNKKVYDYVLNKHKIKRLKEILK